MRKLNTIWMMIAMMAIALPAMATMSTSNVRKNTRFLTDRMAYELNLTQNQYDDIYEINYDFINNVRYIMSDVARGDEYAVDRYYDYLDVRNDDLRWILSSSQYSRFMDIEYFYRPIYTQNRKWAFRVYNVYANVNYFYFGRPYHYSTYCGGHYRTHYNNISFYKGRWNTRYNFRDSYHSYRGIRDDRRYDNHRRNDFGVNARPNNGYRPTTGNRPNSNYRPDNNRRPENNYRPESNRRKENSRYENNSNRTSRGESTRVDNSSRSERNSSSRTTTTTTTTKETKSTSSESGRSGARRR